MTEQLIQLEKLMRQHDWWYHRSDDARAFNRGEQSSKRLKRLCLLAEDQEAVKALWDKHCPNSSTIYYDGTPRAVG